MSNETKHSGPVDVLAVMDVLSASMDKYPATTIQRQDWGSSLSEVRAAVAELIERDAQCSREIEALRYERNHARASKEHCIKILSGIHALLYPAPVTNAEGMTFVFHSPHVHEQMQALSDRIRAIPDEIAAAGGAS